MEFRHAPTCTLVDMRLHKISMPLSMLLFGANISKSWSTECSYKPTCSQVDNCEFTYHGAWLQPKLRSQLKAHLQAVTVLSITCPTFLLKCN